MHWTFEANLKEGQGTITPRAMDSKGNVQYDVAKQKWNQQGYVYGAYVPHPIVVTATLPTPTPVPTVQPAAAAATGGTPMLPERLPADRRRPCLPPRARRCTSGALRVTGRRGKV